MTLSVSRSVRPVLVLAPDAQARAGRRRRAIQ
jgi:hypothetical protein